MPELDVKYSGPVSPKRRRGSRSPENRGLKNHRNDYEDEHKSRYIDKDRNKTRFRFGGSRSRSRSRERDRINWSDQRDREHGVGSRSDYYEKRDDAQRQRQDAFIARLDALFSTIVQDIFCSNIKRRWHLFSFCFLYQGVCRNARELVNWDVLKSGDILQESENLSKYILNTT